MKKGLLVVLLLLTAGIVGVTQARADSSATVSIWSEAGEIAPGGGAPTVDKQLADNEPGGSASTGYGWPLVAPLRGDPCPGSSCAWQDAGATASVDERSGMLRAGSGSAIYVANAPDLNWGGDSYVTSSASFEDSITLSKPATVLLVGHVDGSMAATNGSDYWLNDPRVTGSVNLGFDLGPSGPPVGFELTTAPSSGRFDSSYEPEVNVLCHDAANDCISGVPAAWTPAQPIGDTFSIPVDLPAGTTGVSGSIDETVSLLVDGEPGMLLYQDGVMNLAGGITFSIDVPDDVVATSASGELPIVGGASAPSDTTPPTSTAVVSPAPNATGWNDGPVTVAISASDEDGGSGVASITYDTGSGPETVQGDSASVPVSAEGTTSVTYYATDVAGNAEAPQTLTVRIDETAPTISASDVTADATGADGATVGYSASASDNLDPSPSLSCDPASGTAFATGSTTVTCTASDGAGNSSTATFTVTVRGAADQIADELSSEGGLGAKQAAALADVQAGKTHAACGVLGAYANQVRALAGKQLSADEAGRLLATVQRIETLLGC
jgi:hypothetical protein